MNLPCFLRPVSVAIGLCTLAFAQDASVIREAFGVSRLDGGVWAGGPDYSARFDERGAEFSPRNGRPGERAYPVRCRFESVRRGSVTVFERTADVAPEIDGNRVCYPHASGPTEVWEAHRDGIEQSFVFATKPAGSGDLVVRLAIATDLPLTAASDENLRYELPGVAGVTFGAITGVDANGATARGAIRVDAGGHHAEWVLPAAFVEHANYPLVLDPLIGSVISIGDAANGPDRDPNVAFDDSTNRYLVVWNDALYGTNDEMRGQFVGPGGTLVGSAFFIGWGHLTSRALANINGTDRFLVTSYTHYWSGITSAVRVRSIDASSGVVSNSVDVEVCFAGSGVSVDVPVVGGDSRDLVTSDSALLAYERNGGIRTCIVHVPASGDPVVSPASFTTIGTGVTPSVTAHGGNPLRWLVTWRDNPGTSPQHIRAGIVGSSGTLCAPAVLLYTAIGSEEVYSPVCAAADGATFFVAWSVVNSGNSDILGMMMTWSGACGGGTLTHGSLIAPVTTPGDCSTPAVAFAKDKFLLAWKHQTSPSAAMQVFIKGLDPATCASCGAEWAVGNGIADAYSPSMASRFAAGDTASDEALLVWSNDAVRAWRFEATGNDVVTSMGGGCSLSGFNDFATYNGDAVLGNANFQLVLSSPVSLPLVMILGFSSLSAPCGSCTIVPSPDILMPATNPYPLAIPCDPLLVGQDLYTQWLLLKPSNCPILPDFAFSNALRFTIGE